MYSVREFGNTCLLLSLDKVLEYGEILNVPQADERECKVERKEVPLFDKDVYREAIINAFVHNAWTSGNAPMLTVFSDRIEILSRGTIPPGQTMEGFYAGDKVGDKVGDKNFKLNPTCQRILQEMRNNPNITQPQLMSAIGVGKTAIKNNITFLKKNGYIERVGSNKNGYWSVL